MTGRGVAASVVGAVALGMSAVGVATPLAAARDAGTDLIGTPAPDWDLVEWINSEPISQAQLAGHVVLVRWWTGPDCPFCARSAPQLNAWYEAYHEQGLVILGFYHHKSPTPLSREHVGGLIERYGFQFPVAIDPEWQTLKRWWLDGHHRAWTSVSFLIDRQGIIRYVHPGGSYAEHEAKTMESLIQRLLQSPSIQGFNGDQGIGS